MYLKKTNLTNEERITIKDFQEFMEPLVSSNIKQSKTVFITSFMSIHYCLKLETIIGHALEKRGYKVIIITNILNKNLVQQYHSKINNFEILLLEDHILFFDFIKVYLKIYITVISLWRDKNFIKKLYFQFAPIGIHCLSTFLSSFIGKNKQIDSKPKKKLLRLARRSALLLLASNRIIKSYQPSFVLSVEKGFVGTCEMYYAALHKSIDFIQWTSCHKPNSLMLKRYCWKNYRDHPFSLSNETWADALNLSLPSDFRTQVLNQFKTGYEKGEWFEYKKVASGRKQCLPLAMINELGLNNNHKIAIIFSHIINDANLFYGDDLFEGGFEEWLVETVRVASLNSSVNWILKLHPANIYRNTVAGYQGEFLEILALKKAYGCIPSFLKIVYPDSDISSLSFFKIADYGITVRGTVGMELPCFGVPVLTAGTGRYSGKGFTIDSSTKEQYLEKVKNIHKLPPLSDTQLELALRYAYFIFFKRPAKYSSCIKEIYRYTPTHPLHRDLYFKKSINNVCENKEIRDIVNFILSTKIDYIS